MNYANLNKALKFARAPQQALSGFIQAAQGSPIHHQNPHDLGLHDFLMDHDDPRHLIVGKHLRDPNGEVPPGYHETGEQDTFQTPDGVVALNRFVGPGGHSQYESIWNAQHPLDPNDYRQYRAVLSPEEAHQIRTGLSDVEHTGFHFTQPPFL